MNILVIFFCCCLFSKGLAQDNFHIQQFIVLRDVLRPEEKIGFNLEYGLNARFLLLKNDSKLTDLDQTYPIELAATGSCLDEMETLNRCLSNLKGNVTEKLAITTRNISKPRKLGIRQFATIDPYGKNVLVDEDCTNNQIDLEECIVRNNRYYPCTPPERDLKKFRKLFVERMELFSKTLPILGYKLVPVNLRFEFGNLESYEILNYNERYGDYAKAFVRSLPVETQPAVYENFKQSFLNIRKVAPKNSLRFSKFEKMLRAAACQRTGYNFPEILENLNKKIAVMKKKFENADSELYAIESSIPLFFSKFPQEIPETCNEEFKSHVQNKNVIFDALEWNCKEPEPEKSTS